MKKKKKHSNTSRRRRAPKRNPPPTPNIDNARAQALRVLLHTMHDQRHDARTRVRAATMLLQNTAPAPASRITHEIELSEHQKQTQDDETRQLFEEIAEGRAAVEELERLRRLNFGFNQPDNKTAEPSRSEQTHHAEKE